MANMVELTKLDTDHEEEAQEEETEHTGELDLEGLDDKELDCYIKSDEEAKATGEVWMTLYGADLIELEGKLSFLHNQVARVTIG